MRLSLALRFDLHLILAVFHRCNARAVVVEQSSGLSKDAKLRAKLELAARTGDTDSEEDGLDNEDGNDEDECKDDDEVAAGPSST